MLNFGASLREYYREFHGTLLCQLRISESFIVTRILIIVLTGLPAEHSLSRGAPTDLLPTYPLFIYANRKTVLKELVRLLLKEYDLGLPSFQKTFLSKAQVCSVFYIASLIQQVLGPSLSKTRKIPLISRVFKKTTIRKSREGAYLQ